MNKPHKHAELIKAWADGATIEYCDTLAMHECDRKHWILMPVDSIGWNARGEYRIKPEPPAKVYPVTGMSGRELKLIWDDAIGDHTGFLAVANAALRHAIDADQVVPMAEVITVARELRPRERVVRDLAIADAVLAACQQALFSIPGFDGIDLPAIIATVKD